MDVVLNDKSLCGQFTEENFDSFMAKEMIPSMKIMKEYNCSFYKKMDTYNRKITPTTTLMNYMRLRGNPTVARFKMFLSQLYREDPFWDNSPSTDQQADYKCDRLKNQEIPNCISEVLEREGILFSFPYSDFDVDKITVSKDGKENFIKNVNSYSSFNRQLTELGVVEKWFCNSFMIELNYKFEIRFEEKNHNVAHFHVSNTDYAASYEIGNWKRLAGKLPGADERIILDWAEKNNELIKNLWNDIHGERIWVR